MRLDSSALLWACSFPTVSCTWLDMDAIWLATADVSPLQCYRSSASGSICDNE